MASTTDSPILAAALAALEAEKTTLKTKALERIAAFGLDTKTVTVAHADMTNGIVVVTDGQISLSVRGTEIRRVAQMESGWGQPSEPLTSLAHLARLLGEDDT